MDESLLDQVAAWLDFYRELGIESLYLRSPAGISNSPPVDQTTRPAPPAEASAKGTSEQADILGRQRPGASGEPDLSREVASVPIRALPNPPEQSLNLFEKPAPARVHETLEQIREDLGDCQRCRLAQGRMTIVFGEGNPHAELVFVGEGPGAEEEKQGRPFVGRAGQLLNRMLQLIGMKREDVYIANIVKCRPPGNRTPERDEIETCSPFLFRQLQTIQPRLICCLGSVAVRTVLKTKDPISRIRGRFFDYGHAKLLPTFHPAYILRNPQEEKILRGDFEKIRAFLDRNR